MSLHPLHRSAWSGEPQLLGVTFHLHKSKCGRQLEAVCRVMTHQLGWELRLEVAGSLQMSRVCRSQDEALDASEQWKTAMVAKGWQ